MRAIILEGFGGLDKLVYRNIPEPEPTLRCLATFTHLILMSCLFHETDPGTHRPCHRPDSTLVVLRLLRPPSSSGRLASRSLKAS